MNTNPPDWFQQATDIPFSDRYIQVDGCTIHYQLWSEHRADLPGVLFVHGHGANAHWWDFIAPGLMQEYRIAALDLSGAGDSGHRSSYSTGQFVEEIMSVCTDADFEDHCILVGHSFGGRLVRCTAHSYPDRISAIVLADSAIGLPGTRSVFNPPRLNSRPARFYPSQRDAARRFRLRPPQPCENRFIVDYIAAHSVMETADGWCWKLDQRVFSKMPDLSNTVLNAGEMLKRLTCPIGIIYADQSRFFPEDIRAYIQTLVPEDDIKQIQGAHHHLFLDQPLLFISALRRLLSGWNERELSTQ